MHNLQVKTKCSQSARIFPPSFCACLFSNVHLKFACMQIIRTVDRQKDLGLPALSSPFIIYQNQIFVYFLYISISTPNLGTSEQRIGINTAAKCCNYHNSSAFESVHI